MKIWLAVLVLMQLTFLSCNEQSGITSPTAVQTSIDGLIPMKTGNYWVYLFSSYDTTGMQVPSHTLDTVKIVKDTLINNETWFIFKSGAIQTNRADGVWELIDGQPRLILTTTLNDSNRVDSKTSNCGDYIKLVSVNQNLNLLGTKHTVNVYNWIFPCLNNELGYKYFIEPHLGKLRIEIYSSTLSGYYFLAYTQELVETSVK